VIPDLVGRQYLKVVTVCLSPWRSHIDFDDLVAYCMLRVLGKLSRIPEAERLAATGLVITVARQAVGDFMASPQNRLRTTDSRGRPVPTLVPYDGPELDMHCSEPDFAPPLLHRLWCSGVWQEARAMMTGVERLACQLSFGHGRSEAEIGRQTGVSTCGAHRRLHRGLNRYRERHGLPLSFDGRVRR
jgi:DNA-directed RNA polymerase specialized sigma24 family protein